MRNHGIYAEGRKFAHYRWGVDNSGTRNRCGDKPCESKKHSPDGKSRLKACTPSAEKKGSRPHTSKSSRLKQSKSKARG